MYRLSILLTILPPILLPAGVLLAGQHMRVSETDIVYFLYLNIILVVSLWPCAVVMHEAGHIAMAWLVGGRPFGVKLGTGTQVAIFNWNGFNVELKRWPRSGLAMASFNEGGPIRLQMIIFILGGVIFNAAFGLIALATKGVEFGWLDLFYEVDFARGLVLANAFCILFAIVPYRPYLDGTKVMTDGLSLIYFAFLKKQNLRPLAKWNKENFDWLRMYHQGRFEEMADHSQKLMDAYPEIIGNRLAMCNALCCAQRYEEAVALFDGWDEKIESEPVVTTKAGILNLLAWASLLKDDLEKADSYSEKAFECGPHVPAVRGSRGVVLIAKGNLEAGMKLLERDKSRLYVNQETLQAAIYFMVAHHHQGRHGKSRSWRRFVERNRRHLEPDLRLLYERELKAIR